MYFLAGTCSTTRQCNVQSWGLLTPGGKSVSLILQQHQRHSFGPTLTDRLEKIQERKQVGLLKRVLLNRTLGKRNAPRAKTRKYPENQQFCPILGDRHEVYLYQGCELWKPDQREKTERLIPFWPSSVLFYISGDVLNPELGGLASSHNNSFP